MAWKVLNPAGVVAELKRRIAGMQQQWRGARIENEQLRKENGRLRQQREELEKDRDRLRRENEELKRRLEQALRANKRQAAPFSRGKRKDKPKRPGRKPGAQYGRHQRKRIPEKVDEVIVVPPPTHCPDPNCGGALRVEDTQFQYQQEIVRKTFWRRFDIPVCRCTVCDQRVQGRHRLQTSDALGAAAVQLGPEALALGVQMNKGLGLPHADVAAVLQHGYGLLVNRSTICRAVDRLARRGEATWNALREAARRSLINGIDETGWRVDALATMAVGRGERDSDVLRHTAWARL